MKRSYYLFNPGKMSRKDNTLKFVATTEQGLIQPAKFLPVEGIDNLYIFGCLSDLSPESSNLELFLLNLRTNT